MHTFQSVYPLPIGQHLWSVENDTIFIQNVPFYLSFNVNAIQTATSCFFYLMVKKDISLANRILVKWW